MNTGDVLQNRYRVVRLVGQGGFGAVYRAWDSNLQVPVALKENNDIGPEAQRQFQREALLLANLRHPNLPRVSDHFIVPGQGQYLVMDFIEGKSLSQLLRERGGPLGEAETLGWIRQVCDALRYLHARTPPVIHRDIKPQNIIITPDGRAVLVDFGISKVYETARSTTMGARAVTPGYSPPEQYGAARTDARSDIYALGATLYTLLTGQEPPESVSLVSGAATLPAPRALNRAITPGMEQAILQAMNADAGRRLQNAAALERALATPLAAGGPIVGTTGRLTTTEPTPPARGASSWLWAIVLLVLLAVALLLFLRGLGLFTPPVEPAASFDGPTEVVTVVVGETPTGTATVVAGAPVDTPTATPATEVLTSVTPTAPAQAGSARRFVLPDGSEREQVFVPTGTFLMGLDAGEPDERPAHEVVVDSFWLDRAETSNGQFEAFVNHSGYLTTAEREGIGNVYADKVWEDVAGANWRHPRGPGSDLSGMADYAVVQVSWLDASAYCAWAGGRLPTEAEWEYAARGAAAPVYPWGESFNSFVLNFCDRNCTLNWADLGVDDGFSFAAPVTSFESGASWVGALNMAGNVWEWVNDRYSADYYQDAPSHNPTGPDTGGRYVLRGGAWYNSANGVRAMDRGNNAPEARSDSIGFRCAYPASVDSQSDLYDSIAAVATR